MIEMVALENEQSCSCCGRLIPAGAVGVCRCDDVEGVFFYCKYCYEVACQDILVTQDFVEPNVSFVEWVSDELVRHLDDLDCCSESIEGNQVDFSFDGETLILFCEFCDHEVKRIHAPICENYSELVGVEEKEPRMDTNIH